MSQHGENERIGKYCVPIFCAFNADNFPKDGPALINIFTFFQWLCPLLRHLICVKPNCSDGGNCGN